MKPKIRKGSRRPRVARPKEKGVLPGYDSNWEYELHSGILNEWSIHSEKAEYIVEHTYHPDFIREIDGKKSILRLRGASGIITNTISMCGLRRHYPMILN